ncbi:hypothetical protein HRR78_006828 [Exophiala dermatitidis]|nr:hypothetical protein HRR75_006534 [Exophiala dermatitidis]KAJ4542739.1 hypothetical protein HRR78_006828 [Exophiala dermatitidis]
MPFPETLNKKPRVIFFTDFDGTITLQDTNDFITDNYGMGYEERRKLFHAVINHTDTFRNTFQQMLDSWHLPFPKVLEILRDNITLDPYFKEFMVWAREHDVPVIVLSSGMIPVLETLLRHLLGEDLMSDIEIVANEVQLRAPGNSLDVPDGWTIKFHDDSDGVSDLSAARETDLLFARAGQDLVTWCEKEGIPFTTFENWKTILDETKDIYEGKRTVKNLAEEGLKRYRTNSFEENSHLRPTIK